MQYLCCPRHPTRVLRSLQAGIAVAHQHASSGRRAARPALRERRRSPRVLSLSGTAAGAQRAQIRPTRVQEGGSDTAKRCFRGPHELAFIRAKIFIYPQFASSAVLLRSAAAAHATGLTLTFAQRVGLG